MSIELQPDWLTHRLAGRWTFDAQGRDLFRVGSVWAPFLSAQSHTVLVATPEDVRFRREDGEIVTIERANMDLEVGTRVGWVPRGISLCYHFRHFIATTGACPTLASPAIWFADLETARAARLPGETIMYMWGDSGQSEPAEERLAAGRPS